MSGSIPPVAFSDPPLPQQDVLAAELIGGGPVAAMHRDLALRLALAFPPAQFQHRTMPARLTPSEWARYTERCPFVGLGFVRMAPASGALVRPRVWSGRAEWLVMFVVRNPKIEAQLLGDGLGCGLAGMLAVATAALHGRGIAGIGACQVGEGGAAYSESWASENASAAALNISVPFDLVDQAGLARLDDFLRLGQRWAGLPDLVADVRDDEVDHG